MMTFKSSSVRFFFFLPFLGPLPAEYGGSQARGLIRAVAAGQCGIRATSATYTTAHGERQILNPLSKARDGTCNLMVPSRIR